MTDQNDYKSALKAAIHETMTDLFDAGVVDEQTMHRFDASCLVDKSVNSESIPRSVTHRRRGASAIEPVVYS
ncbi:MAG: hypothetical protein H7834_05090 [Magnetococcus sp. YQC-9]